MRTRKIRLFGVDVDVRGQNKATPTIKKERATKEVAPAITNQNFIPLPIKQEPTDDLGDRTSASTGAPLYKLKTEPNPRDKENQQPNMNVPYNPPRWHTNKKKKKKPKKNYIFPVKCLCADENNVFVQCSQCNQVRRLGKQYCLAHMNPERIPRKFTVELTTTEVKPPANELGYYNRAKKKWIQKTYSRLHILMDHDIPEESKSYDPYDRWEYRDDPHDRWEFSNEGDEEYEGYEDAGLFEDTEAHYAT